MKLEKYSFGIGDRFGAEGAAQLRAFQQSERDGVLIIPVWNKSNREHMTIGTSPEDTRLEADNAVKTCGWTHPYYVDADHIGQATVGRFLAPSDFFTIDVADFIGVAPEKKAVQEFVKALERFKGTLSIPGIDRPFIVTDQTLSDIAARYLSAMTEAGRVYRAIADRKGGDNFIPEVSVDEAGLPQTPAELFFILAAAAREGIPLQTIAPKFTGSFLKGIDYVGDRARFQQEFEDDLAVLAFAVRSFNLPSNLKLSVHSGSDKFSLYSVIYRAIRKSGAGLHIKTAGTTWLEELIGLASAGGEGLKLAKDVYAAALLRYDELCGPYRTVISIDRMLLPKPEAVAGWSGEEYVETLRHDQQCSRYSVHFRQLVHVAYKVAAEMGERYAGLLRECRKEIEENVTLNLYERHMRPLFLGKAPRNTSRLSAKISEAGTH
jgi:hypothetical protein